MDVLQAVPNPEDVLHPLWLGLLILFTVIIVIGLLCCIRIKCRSLMPSHRHENDDTSNNEKPLQNSYSQYWSSHHSPTVDRPPKLYKLVRMVQNSQFQKQISLTDEINNESQCQPSNSHQIGPLSPIIDTERNDEIARKFYASMRKNSQCHSSSSNDSFHDEETLSTNNNIFPTIDQSARSKREENTELFHVSGFYQYSIDKD